MEVLQVLNESGELAGQAPASMGEAEIVEAMRWMLLSRAIDERVIALQRMGLAGVYGPVAGQEAAVVGSAMALDPARDWMVPASREQPAMVRHGQTLDRVLAGYMGRLNHARIPNGVRLLPRQSAIGTQIPHAVGLAWGLKLRRQRAAVMVYFGEGAASEGDFHEACNLAGVMAVPLVLILINNHWAISTPASRQSAAASLASRAEGYGFPGVAVDGDDIFAMYSAAREAVDRALRGQGPTLIEARTYRMGFHNTSDNPREYRAAAEEEEAGRRDPIDRLRRFATRIGLWSDDIHARVKAEVTAEVDAAYRLCAELPPPSAEDVFEHVYAELPPRLQKQRGESLKAGPSGEG
ncbi:MAG TPA: thiamine pyrophosphate-dependent enzyme [Candidatus Dormibacteraeota bacterium]|nr:thiamine pyrophosphate-dependent enzyme [Candidatus Dormibacteraeota bacterium]